MGRAPCCDKASVKKGPWSPEEDAKLKSFIEQHGTGGNWIALPHKIGLNRCGKSCRLRWLNYLRPNIKHGGFSEEEDRIICNLYISIGSRWSIIAAQLPGRTDNDIKNYWNTRLKKKLLGGRQRDSQPSVQLRKLAADYDSGDGFSQTLNESALDRLRLHMQLQGLHSPFSFYNNTAIWPKFSHENNQKIIETVTTEAIATSHESPLKHPQQANMCNSMIANIQENIGVPRNSSSFSNNDNELHDLLYGKENQVTQLDCFKEMHDEEGMGWWESSIGFEDQKSSSSSWDSALGHQHEAVIREYGVGYDL